MSKSTRKIDSNQLNIFDYLRAISENKSTAEASEGSLNIEAALRRALSAALKQCRLSVFQVAGEMSHLLSETITADMIYSWTAESKTGHRIWASRLAAFCKVTGSRAPLEILVEAAGMYALPGPEALRAEIQRFHEAERNARAEKRKRLVFLEWLERGEK